MMINEKRYTWTNAVLLCLLAIMPVLLLAQIRVVDSLENELNNPQLSDADRIANMLARAEAYRQVDIVKAQKQGEETLQAAQKHGEPALTFKALMSLGVTLISSLEYSLALEHFIKAANICDAYASEDIWKKRKAQALINIGGVHWAEGEFQKAKEYLQSSIAILQTINEPIVLADNLVALGTIAENLGQLDEGLDFLNQAIPIYRQQNNSKGLAGAYSFIGDIYLKKKDGQKALYYKNKNLDILKSLDSPVSLLKAYAGVGIAHLELNNPYQAKPNLLTAARLAEKAGDKETLSVICRQLAKCYELVGAPDSAIHYWKNYEQHIKAIYDKEKARQRQELELKFHIQQEKQENALMKQTAEAAQLRSKVLIYTNIFFVILAALIVWFLARIRYKNKQLALLNQQMQDANEELRQISTEKKFLATLLAHDLRHPLTLIQLSLFELQSANNSQKATLLKEMEEAANNIEEMSRRIMDVENMDQGASLSIEMRAVNAWDVLCKTKAEFEGYATKKHIAVVLAMPAESNKPLLAKADPYFLTRIINNLLSNAIKYAPDGTTVTLKAQKEANSIQFLVIDQGPGLDQADQAKVFQQMPKLKPKASHGESSMGYGLFIAKRYVEAMGGRIAVNSDLNKGSTFIVELPQA